MFAFACQSQSVKYIWKLRHFWLIANEMRIHFLARKISRIGPLMSHKSYIAELTFSAWFKHMPAAWQQLSSSCPPDQNLSFQRKLRGTPCSAHLFSTSHYFTKGLFTFNNFISQSCQYIRGWNYTAQLMRNTKLWKTFTCQEIFDIARSSK